MTRDGRLGVGIIGAGRVGPVIGAALAGAGHAVTGITHGSDDERVESVLPGVPFLDAPEVVRRSELVVLAVPHDQLPRLVSGLAEVGAWQMGQIVMHVDPGYGLDVLAPATAQGALPVAVHPAIAFTGTSMDLRVLRDAYAAVTAPAVVLPIAQALAVEIGCEPVVVADADRAEYGEAPASLRPGRTCRLSCTPPSTTPCATPTPTPRQRWVSPEGVRLLRIAPGVHA